MHVLSNRSPTRYLFTGLGEFQESFHLTKLKSDGGLVDDPTPSLQAGVSSDSDVLGSRENGAWENRVKEAGLDGTENGWFPPVFRVAPHLAFISKAPTYTRSPP